MQTEPKKTSHLSAQLVLSITLSQQEQLKLFELLEKPPAPHPKLSKAIERYKRVMENDAGMYKPLLLIPLTILHFCFTIMEYDI